MGITHPLLAFSTLLVISIPLPVKALPFHENCASMQSYFNSARWGNSTYFSGYENQEPLIFGIFDGTKHDLSLGISKIICKNGYVKETSPMGTRVCEASISYEPQKKQKMSWNQLMLLGHTCRWR